jgi:hypothetical protein
VEGATYLTIKGLEIVGNGGDAINLSGGPSNITLEDLDIHDVDVGINFRSSMNNITVRRNHIRRTGIGGGTGEGMYVGCNDATCIVRDSLIENNWIHDALPGTTQGDGIEVKVGSHSNVIRDNVIYNMPYPGIFVYGTGTNPSNLVEGNVIWNCLEGIYAVADAIVRNNIVINSGTGLSLYGHAQVAQIKNIVAVNNTLVGNDSGLYMRWGSGVSNVRLANNAVYSAGKSAVNAGSGIPAGAAVAANYIEGSSSVAIDSARFFDGGSAASAFVDAANRDFWPRAGSVLIDRGSATEAPALDFNRSARNAPVDVGAYEALGLAGNPGWRITEGFKGVTAGGGGGGGGGDTSAAAAADNVGVAGVQFRLDGASIGAEITAAPYSMNWDSTGASNGAHTLTAVARDAAGNSTVSSPVTVTVSNATPPAPPPPPPPTPPPAPSAGGGGGCTVGAAGTADPMLAVLLALAAGTLAWRRHALLSARASSSPRTTAD